MTNTTATAFAPASIGNVAVGFDMLGLAIAGAGDRVTARRVAAPGVRVTEVRDPDDQPHLDLSSDSAENTASVAAAALWAEAREDGGLELSVAKGVPLKSGMGSSAASAVAGALAANALLAEPRDVSALLPFALAGESIASGTPHADNVAPSLLGGLVLSPPGISPRCIDVPVSSDLASVLVHPNLEVSTADARSRLRPEVSVQDWLLQQGYLAGFLMGVVRNDHELIAACLKDVIIEPQRQDAVTGFTAAKEAALAAGGLGASLSGSGPSMFAISAADRAPQVAAAMQAAFAQAGLESSAWTSPLSSPGACIVDLST